MRHLSTVRRHRPSLESSQHVKARFLRVASNSTMLHPCAGPVNSFEFNLAAVLPGGRLIALAAPLISGLHGWSTSIYGVDYQGSNPVCSHAFALSVSISPGGRLRHWCSFHLRVSPLHRKFPPLLYRYSLAQWFWMQFPG